MSLAGIENYHRPKQSVEALALLTTYGDGALIVNGGTFIHGLVARGLITGVKHIIDINDLKLDYINYDVDKLTIGSTTRFEQLENDLHIQNEAALGAIKDALAYPPGQIQNAASVGGCVAASCPFLDLPISLLALRAKARVYSARGERDTNLDNFFVSLFCSNMESNEMLKELVVPIPKMRSASAFEKLETNANDLAILNSAVSMEVSGKIYEKITIFIGGGVGETPVRATSAETVLKGQTLTQERVSHAAARAKEDVVPLSDHRASAEYRIAMTEVLVRRCLQRSLERLDIT